MKKTRVPILALLGLVCLALHSCITSDQLVTLTIHPDGSADWVRFQSNIRSTQEGDEGARELKRFAEDFETGRDPDLVRVRESGGEVLEARWVRSEEPYASVVSARFPRAAALEAFFSQQDDRGEKVVETRFTRDGKRRRLSIRIARNDQLAAGLRRTESDRREDRATSVSETRIAVVGGRITAVRGFAVAADRRSALLDLAEIGDLMQGGATELFLEWEVRSD